MALWVVLRDVRQNVACLGERKTMKTNRVLTGLVLVVAGAALGQTTAPATKPAAPTPLSTVLSRVPSNLQPIDNETDVRTDTRAQWIAKNLKGTTVAQKVIISSTGVNDDGSVSVVCLSETVNIFGQKKQLHILALVPKANAAPLIAMTNGQSTTICGELANATFIVEQPHVTTSKIWSVRLANCSVR